MIYRKNDEIKFLKLFVYLMGIVLMIGCLSLTYIIYRRNLPSLNLVKTSENDCISQTGYIELPERIEQLQKEENKFIITTYPYKDKQEIILYDSCKNVIIKRIEVDFNKNRTASSLELEGKDRLIG